MARRIDRSLMTGGVSASGALHWPSGILPAISGSGTVGGLFGAREDGRARYLGTNDVQGSCCLSRRLIAAALLKDIWRFCHEYIH